MALNNYEEIVTNFASPTLVLAGPGAGLKAIINSIGNARENSMI